MVVSIPVLRFHVSSLSALWRLSLRHLIERYARMVDDRAWDTLPDVFTPDGVLSGPGYEMTGYEELRGGLALIDQYTSTLHLVHNHYVELAGDTATGEAYSVAGHLYETDGVARKLDMGIRYRDTYRRDDGRWRLLRREFHLAWQQDLPLNG